MALIYDELGNVIGEDTPSVDEMLYELSLPKTVRRMVTSPSNDLSALSKAQTYKDIASGFGSAGESLVRGAGAAALGVTGDMLKHFQDTPLIPGVTDNLTLSDILPGIEYLTPKEEQTYELPVKRHPNASYPAPRAKQEIMGLPYVTTSDILEAAPSRMTAPFGDKEANDFMETLGMFLQPSMQAGARRGIINMVETTGKMPSLTRESAQAFARDYANAMNGIYPETPTMGSMAADFARQGKAVAEDVGDVMARQAMRRADKEGNVSIFGLGDVVDTLGPKNLYAVKPTGGQLLKSVDPVTGLPREVENSSIAGISQLYETIRKQDQGQGLINQYLRTYLNRPGIQNMWENFSGNKVLEEFPDAPTSADAHEAFRIKYPTSAMRNERMIEQFDEFAKLPAAQAAAAERGISIPTFEDYQARIAAANQWGQKGLTNYIQKYIGTKEDPNLQAATRGLTYLDPEKLTENAVAALNYGSPQGLRRDRARAGFSEEGEIQPFLKEKLTELKAIDAQLREMVVRRNELYEEARTQNINPASIPEYAELTNKLVYKTAEKERVTQQAENYKLGKSYETLSDLAIEPRKAGDLKKKLSYAEKLLFPYLDKTPDEAILYDVDVPTLEKLGITDMASKFMDDILTGKMPIEQIGNTSIPKYALEFAEKRIAQQLAEKRDVAARQKAFDNYLQNIVQELPSDKVYGNAAALEITNAMPEDEIIRHLSTDTEVLDHCVGTGGQGARGRSHVPIVDPVTGKVPAGSSGEPNTGYVRSILNKGNKITSLRDIVTGRPIGTIELQKQPDGDYSVGYASGYQNGPMQSMYSESLAKYLNSIANEIAGTGDNLAKNGVLDRTNSSPYEMRNVTGLSEPELKQLSLDGLPRFVTRDDIVNLNNQRRSMLPSSQLNSEVATMNNTYAELLDETQRINFDLQSAEDDIAREELMSRKSEVQAQLDDIGARISNVPIEEITNVARELINDVFPENKTTPRSRLDYLDAESPISLRVQPRIYETMREVLRDQRDAVGAPLSDAQNFVVRTEWKRISSEIARTINGNMYNGRAVAGNIRRNPDRYGLSELTDQVIDGIARQVEEHGIIDPRNAPLELINVVQSSLPAPTITHLNNLMGNVLRGTDDAAFQQAITRLQEYQQMYLNPPEQSLIRNLTEDQRRMAVGELQGRIRDLEQRIQRRPLVNSARPQEQAQDLAVVLDRLQEAIAEDYGQPVADYVADTLATINYNVNTDAPLYIERVRRFADESTDDLPVREAFNMIADRLVQGERANVAANRALREQNAQVANPDANRSRFDVIAHVINTTANERVSTELQGLARQVDIGSDAFGPALENRINDYDPGTPTRLTLIDALTAWQNARTNNAVAAPAVPEPREVTPLTDVLNMEMNRIRDNYDEEVYNAVDRTLTAINDNADLATNAPAFIERVRRNAETAQRNNDTTIHEILTHTADLLTRTLRENSQIAAPAQRMPALPNNIVGNTTQNLINQYPERRQVQSLIDDIEHGELGELPREVQEIPDEIVRDELVSQIIDGLVEYRDSIPANQETLLTAPQIADIVRSEINRQAQIRVLQPNNLRSFINDMTDVLDFDDPANMMNTLDALVVQHNRAGRDGLSDAVNAVLTQINAQARNNRQRGAIEHIARTRGEFTMDNAIDAIDDAFSTIEQRLGDAVLDFAETQNANTSAQFHPALETPQYVAELRRRAGNVEGNNRVALHVIADELENAFTRSQRPEGHKHGGSIQSSKNRLLSPNTDEMRLALLKGK